MESNAFIRGLDPKKAMGIGMTANNKLKIIKHLGDFYNKCGLSQSLRNDQNYLSKAMQDIEQLWLSNLTNISKVKYIMLSESPLWGEEEKYIYRHKYLKESSFFWSKNLLDALIGKGVPKGKLPDVKPKSKFVQVLNQMGFLIIDVSPFALNTVDTAINYSRLSGRKKNNYRDLIEPTLEIYFDFALTQIQNKLSNDSDWGVKVFYRYPRIENHLGIEISNILGRYGMKVLGSPYNNIFRQGGGIDTKILSKIL